MPGRQFKNRISQEEMNPGVRILESGVLQRPVAGILNVSQGVISRMRNLHLTHIYPSQRHGMAENVTGIQLDIRVFFVDYVWTSTVS